MSVNLFEGFKRVNLVVMVAIVIIGVITSFNQDASLNSEIVKYYKDNICVDTYQNSQKINFGYLEVNYCFDKFYDYTDKSNYANRNRLTESEKSSFSKKMFFEWFILFLSGIGITLLCLFGYAAFCKIVKYVVTGFIQNK